MNKNMFMQLQLEGQLAYVNHELKTKGINEVSADMGVSQSWLSKHFVDNGHRYNRTLKLYEVNDEVDDAAEKVKAAKLTEDQIGVLLEMAREYLKAKDGIELDFSLIRDLPEDMTVRTMNISKTLWVKMEAINKRFKIYKKHDLFALMFAEFIARHGADLTDEEISKAGEIDEGRKKKAM